MKFGLVFPRLAERLTNHQLHCHNFRDHEIVFQNAIVSVPVVANTYVIQATGLFGLPMENYNFSSGHLLNDQPPLAEAGPLPRDSGDAKNAGTTANTMRGSNA
jgi:hypothetical protein